MAPTDFRSENQSQLDKLMELFSKFSNVAGRINVSINVCMYMRLSYFMSFS